ncbi:MAG: hypothetical protein QOE54_1418 [Streptosporangiaceae bacterium]|nr:hypothetical protein [Streptosporangiaceae bacterium]
MDPAAGEPADGLRVDAPHAQGVQVGGGNVMVNQFIAAAPAVAWPLLVGRSPLRADAFQERRGLQNAVADALAAGGTAVVTRVLAGDGGTGKTQLAAAVFEHARRNGVDLAVWVTATSRTGVLASYAQAYAATHPGAATGDAERDAMAFLAWLATTDRSWIVVLDDVADPGDLVRLWPAGSSGRVVVTTRRRDAAMAARGPVVDVGVFTPQESMDFLTAKLAQAVLPGDAVEEAGELNAELGHLPLALAQAAAVIINDAITCATYRSMLADRTQSLADLFPPDPGASGDEYEQTLAGTWSLAAERADALAPAGLARPLLTLAAVLDPNGIPEAVLTSQAARGYLAGERDRSNAPARPVDTVAVPMADARRALRNLHRLSLVAHDPSDAVRSVRMHALAQRSTVENLPAGALARLIRTAADALAEAWPEVDREPSLGQVLRANAAAVAGWDRLALWRTAAHPVLVRAGQSLGETGLAHDAIAYFEALFADSLEILGPDHPDTLTTRYELAYWRGEAGDFAGAAAALEQLVADRLRVLGPDHPNTLGTRANLAYWRGHAGDPAGAAAATAQVLADQLRILGPEHPTTLSTRHNLAHWRGQAGDPAAAARATEELLADSLRILGPDHFDTLDTRRNLAYWRGRAGDAAGAAAALEQVLDAYSRVLGPEHPDTMHTRDDLADWRGQAGDPAGAVAAYEQLLADRLRILGPDHPHTLITRHNLAEWRGHAGDLAGAASAYQQLLADQARVLGPEHPHTLRTRFNLAGWRGEAQGAAAAIAVLEPLLGDCLRVLGRDHPETLATRHNLGSWRGRTGDAVGAAATLEEVLADCLRVLRHDHPDTLATRHNLAYWRAKAGDPAGATAAFEQLLPDQVRVLGPDHPDTLETRQDLAGLQEQAGDIPAATAVFQQLHADQQRILGPDHPRTLITRVHLAELRGLAGDPTEAATAYQHLLTDTLRVLGSSHPETRSARAGLDRWGERARRTAQE